MKTLLNSKAVLALAAIAGFAAAYSANGPYAAVGGFVALASLVQLARRREAERNWAASRNALLGYQEILAGRLWTGGDAEILASDRLDNPQEPGPIRYEHICRTKSGSWFIFLVEVAMGRVVFRELYPCDETTAKQRLECHEAVYIRCFGSPAIA